MKHIFSLLVLLVAFGSNAATNCNLLIQSGMPAMKVSLTPIKPWRAYRGQLLPAVSVSKVTDASGDCTFSNVVSAYDYRITEFLPGGSTLSYTNPIPADVSGTTNSAGLFGVRVGETVFYMDGSTSVTIGGSGGVTNTQTGVTLGGAFTGSHTMTSGHGITNHLGTQILDSAGVLRYIDGSPAWTPQGNWYGYGGVAFLDFQNNATFTSVIANGIGLTNGGSTLASIPTPFTLINSNQAAAIAALSGSGTTPAQVAAQVSTNVPYVVYSGTNLVGWTSNSIVMISTNPAFAGTWVIQSGTFVGNNLVLTNTTGNTNVIEFDGNFFYLEHALGSADHYYTSPGPDIRNWTVPWTTTGEPGWTATIYGSWPRVYSNTSARVYTTSDQLNTNLVRVEKWGNDAIAAQLVHTTNSYPFANPAQAAVYAQRGDTIKVGPGLFVGRSFRTQNEVNFLGSGENVTTLQLYGTNFIELVAGQIDGQSFNANGICVQSNLNIGNFTLTNCTLIEAAVSGTSADGSYVHDITVVQPGKDPSSSVGQLPYSGNGVTFDQVGSSVFDRVHIFTGFRGFSFGIGANTNYSVTLRNCSVLGMPSGNVSNIIALCFRGTLGYNVNIEGGTYASINGKTNMPFTGEGITNLACNTPFFVSSQSQGWKINFSGMPHFIVGSTNGGSSWVINEGLAGSNIISGMVKVTQVTDALWKQTNTFNQSFDGLTGNLAGGTNANIQTLFDTTSGTLPTGLLTDGYTNYPGHLVTTKTNASGSVRRYASLDAGNLINIPAANLSGTVAVANLPSSVSTNYGLGFRARVLAGGNLTSANTGGYVYSADGGSGSAPGNENRVQSPAIGGSYGPWIFYVNSTSAWPATTNAVVSVRTNGITMFQVTFTGPLTTETLYTMTNSTIYAIPDGTLLSLIATNTGVGNIVLNELGWVVGKR